MVNDRHVSKWTIELHGTTVGHGSKKKLSVLSKM